MQGSRKSRTASLARMAELTRFVSIVRLCAARSAAIALVLSDASRCVAGIRLGENDSEIAIFSDSHLGARKSAVAVGASNEGSIDVVSGS